MAFSVSSVLNSIVAATTRTPHSVQLPTDQDRFSRRNSASQNYTSMMDPADHRPRSAQPGKTSEALEHDTLARIRDALYRDQQA